MKQGVTVSYNRLVNLFDAVLSSLLVGNTTGLILFEDQNLLYAPDHQTTHTSGTVVYQKLIKDIWA